jgi:hypothetical protein
LVGLLRVGEGRVGVEVWVAVTVTVTVGVAGPDAPVALEPLEPVPAELPHALRRPAAATAAAAAAALVTS